MCFMAVTVHLTLVWDTFPVGGSNWIVWPSRHSHAGMSSCWVSSTGVLVPCILFPHFNKEHSLVTGEGSYQPFVSFGRNTPWTRRRKPSVLSAKSLAVEWPIEWHTESEHPDIPVSYRKCCLGCLGLNASPSQQHQGPHWMYWWQHMPVHTTESRVSFSLGGGFRDWIELPCSEVSEQPDLLWYLREGSGWLKASQPPRSPWPIGNSLG